jgi:hypothetical protein
MESTDAPRCRLCARPLEEVHGHLACLEHQCPLYGVEQEACCAGIPLDAQPDPTEEDEGIPVRWRPPDS